MERTILPMPGNELMARSVSSLTGATLGSAEIRSFPDGEYYVRCTADLRGRELVVVCTLNRPAEQLLPLYFLAQKARGSGAKMVTLLTPYLPYLRQDAVFHEGEALTSAMFASLLSSFLDKIVTVDPHLHRHKSLADIYSIPTVVLHSASCIAPWVTKNVARPLLIGPDSESGQWVQSLAKLVNAPSLVLDKTREGDRHVRIEMPGLERYRDHVPVLVDDIVSTGHTMIESIRHLRSQGMPPPVCLIIHPVFAEGAIEALRAAGAAQVVSCNTISHATNGIDITGLFRDI